MKREIKEIIDSLKEATKETISDEISEGLFKIKATIMMLLLEEEIEISGKELTKIALDFVMFIQEERLRVLKELSK